jgi:AraC-like DNA-binding protein
VAGYRELPPSPDLAAFVACGWVRVVRPVPGALPLPVVPDGCADIITRDHAAPVLVGPDTRARWPALTNGAVITGLRLRPGALRALVGFGAAEVLDISVPLADVSPAARGLHAQLLDTTTLQARLALLEQWVRERLRGTARDCAVIQACRTLAAQPGLDVANVATALGWHVRTLHREFVVACGYGPKMMQRILRVQQATRAAHRALQPLRLSEVAAQAGFADQAHMTREFRAITGTTPSHYLLQCDPALGRWLDAAA